MEEVAALICWLASRECSFSTGAVFDVSGGRGATHAASLRSSLASRQSAAAARNCAVSTMPWPSATKLPQPSQPKTPESQAARVSYRHIIVGRELVGWQVMNFDAPATG